MKWAGLAALGAVVSLCVGAPSATAATIITVDFEDAPDGYYLDPFPNMHMGGGEVKEADGNRYLEPGLTGRPARAFGVSGDIGGYWENGRRLIGDPILHSFDIYLPQGGTVFSIHRLAPTVIAAGQWVTISSFYNNHCAYGCGFWVRGEGARVDNIKFEMSSQPLPEPGAWALLLLGFFGLGAALRQKNSLSRALAPLGV